MEYPMINFGLFVILGMVLGIIFFGGLWLTVRKMPTARWPAVLFLCSAIARTFIVLSGIWYIADGNATSIGACLLGFIGLRLLATHGRIGLGTFDQKGAR